MTFIADCMLGKLAKWLRILGFDVLYFSKIEDDRLLQIAQSDGRTLLSRDNGLLEKAKFIACLLVDSEKWKDQIIQVLEAFDLEGEVRPNSRCIACNRSLKRLPRERARNLVTPFIFAHGRDFAICPSCGRVFWKGTHFDDMETKVSELLRALKKKGLKK